MVTPGPMDTLGPNFNKYVGFIEIVTISNNSFFLLLPCGELLHLDVYVHRILCYKLDFHLPLHV